MSTNPSDYKGLCSHAGKFEGEPRAAEYYWEMVMNGDGETHTPIEDGDVFTLFTVTPEEALAFGDDAGLETGDTVAMFEGNTGFVSLLAFATRDAALWYIKNYCDL